MTFNYLVCLISQFVSGKGNIVQISNLFAYLFLDNCTFGLEKKFTFQKSQKWEIDPKIWGLNVAANENLTRIKGP